MKIVQYCSLSPTVIICNISFVVFLRLDNLIFHETKPEVTAVLDWELSTLGDPLSDLAYNCLPNHLPPTFPTLKGMWSSCVVMDEGTWRRKELMIRTSSY